MKKIFGTMLAIMIVAGTFITVQHVVAGEKGKGGRFIVNSNGTVTDTKTKLIWAAKDNGKTVNWIDARSYCQNYRGGSYTDWRMPTQAELAGLYDEAITFTAANGKEVHLTKLIHLTSFVVWASDTSIADSASAATPMDSSGIFIFYNGKKPKIRAINTTEGCALPVRSAR